MASILDLNPEVREKLAGAAQNSDFQYENAASMSDAYGADNPIKKFFQYLFRQKRGLVGDAAVTKMAKAKPRVVQKAPVVENKPVAQEEPEMSDQERRQYDSPDRPMYKLNPDDFVKKGYYYYPKDEAAYRKAIGVGPKTKIEPLGQYLFDDKYLTKTEPVQIENKYGLNTTGDLLNQERSPISIPAGVNQKEEWLKAYEATKNIQGLKDAYYSNMPTTGFIENSGSLNRGTGVVDFEPQNAKTLSPLSQRIFDYKHSNAFIERLAASHYNKDIDLNKWTSDPSYREDITKKYVTENPGVANAIMQQLNRNLPVTAYDQDPITTGESVSNNPLGFDYIAMQPALHGRNFATKEDQDKAILEVAKKVYDSGKYKIDKNVITSPEQLARLYHLLIEENTNTPEVLSHEAGHQFFDKSPLVKSGRFNVDQVYPENKMLWELNQATKGGKKDYETFKRELGSVTKGKHEDEKINHLESPEETKADIQSLRDYLYAKYNFDHTKDIFDEKTLNTLLQDKEWTSSLIGKRMLERFGNDKDAWLRSMNLIAKNNTPYSLKFA